MKKVRVTLNDGCSGYQILLFRSAEAAYLWMTSAGAYDDIPDTEKIDINSGEFIEAEWIGCEFSYEHGISVRVDRVNIAHAHKPQDAAGFLIGVHTGWTTECDLKFNDHVDEDITIHRMQPDEPDLDIVGLLNDDPQTDDEP